MNSNKSLTDVINNIIRFQGWKTSPNPKINIKNSGEWTWEYPYGRYGIVWYKILDGKDLAKNYPPIEPNIYDAVKLPPGYRWTIIACPENTYWTATCCTVPTVLPFKGYNGRGQSEIEARFRAQEGAWEDYASRQAEPWKEI